MPQHITQFTPDRCNMVELSTALALGLRDNPQFNTVELPTSAGYVKGSCIVFYRMTHHSYLVRYEVHYGQSVECLGWAIMNSTRE